MRWIPERPRTWSWSRWPRLPALRGLFYPVATSTARRNWQIANLYQKPSLQPIALVLYWAETSR